MLEHRLDFRRLPGHFPEQRLVIEPSWSTKSVKHYTGRADSVTRVSIGLGAAENRSGRKSYNSRPELRMSGAPGLGQGWSAIANIFCLSS